MLDFFTEFNPALFLLLSQSFHFQIYTAVSKRLNSRKKISFLGVLWLKILFAIFYRTFKTYCESNICNKHKERYTYLNFIFYQIELIIKRIKHIYSWRIKALLYFEYFMHTLFVNSCFILKAIYIRKLCKEMSFLITHKLCELLQNEQLLY